ncbi:MAG: amidohydrolase [Bacteroidales bacterium]|nr:amidohydrolase [Bacteroidales bacterium]
MQDINITIIQSDLFWEDIDKNLNNFSEKISSVNRITDIIILPEMFTTGFSMNTGKHAEDINGKTIRWMSETAKNKNCVVTGSMILKKNDSYYNSLIWMTPEGKFERYDKRHLFRMAHEHEYYKAGTQKIIISYKGWKFCPMICYDLRFPVWSRNKFSKSSGGYEYDCLIYVANWPVYRINAWKSLLIARAIENQSYAIGVNRIGTDGKNAVYSGDSMVVDVTGIVLSKTRPDEESVETINLSFDKLQKNRESFPFGVDSDEYKIV